MTSPNILLGKRGEYAVGTVLLRPKNATGQSMFDPCPLGEKAELLDFVVRLQKDGHPYGPYFFLQVKATEKAPEGGSIPAIFEASEVIAAQAMKAPIYVAAVDASKRTVEAIYIAPVYAERKNGIARIKTSKPLSDDTVCQALFDEVDNHFKMLKSAFNTPKNYSEDLVDEEMRIA